MKKILVIAVIVFAASWALADTAQLTVAGFPYGTAGGPILMNVQPVTPPGPAKDQLLICWSDENQIAFGDTWLANVYTASNLPISSGGFPETLAQYEQIAYLSKELFAAPTDLDLQKAIWFAAGLFNGQQLFGQALTDYNDAVANANFASLNGIVFYIPVGGEPGPAGYQPMVGYVPEPGSLMLLGTGILGAAGAIRRRFMI